MVLFLISLVMIFAAAILGYVVTRIANGGPWPPPGMTRLLPSPAVQRWLIPA